MECGMQNSGIAQYNAWHCGHGTWQLSVALSFVRVVLILIVSPEHWMGMLCENFVCVCGRHRRYYIILLLYLGGKCPSSREWSNQTNEPKNPSTKSFRAFIHMSYYINIFVVCAVCTMYIVYNIYILWCKISDVRYSCMRNEFWICTKWC